jgi:flagellar motility protein MotE (MotC chaperone)
MPKENNGSHERADESRVLKGLALLTLPWLSFQRDMLALMKKGIEDASHIRPLENLASRQLQALAMIVDPSGKFRNLIDHDVQEKIKDVYAQAFPKFVANSVRLIETQEAVLISMSEQFDKLRKNKTSDETETKSS